MSESQNSLSMNIDPFFEEQNSPVLTKSSDSRPILNVQLVNEQSAPETRKSHPLIPYSPANSTRSSLVEVGGMIFHEFKVGQEPYFQDIQGNYEEPKITSEYSKEESEPGEHIPSCKKYATRAPCKHPLKYAKDLLRQEGEKLITRLVAKKIQRDLLRESLSSLVQRLKQVPMRHRRAQSEKEAAIQLWSYEYHCKPCQVEDMIEESYSFFVEFCHTKKIRGDILRQQRKKDRTQAGTRHDVKQVLKCPLGKLLLYNRFVAIWRALLELTDKKPLVQKKFQNFLAYIEN